MGNLGAEMSFRKYVSLDEKIPGLGGMSVKGEFESRWDGREHESMDDWNWH